MTNDKNYETHDMALAAALLTSGHRPINLNISNPRRVCFVFEQTVELNGCVNSYWTKALAVEPKSYFDSLRDLKSWMYSEQDNAAY